GTKCQVWPSSSPAGWDDAHAMPRGDASVWNMSKPCDCGSAGSAMLGPPRSTVSVGGLFVCTTTVPFGVKPTATGRAASEVMVKPGSQTSPPLFERNDVITAWLPAAATTTVLLPGSKATSTGTEPPTNCVPPVPFRLSCDSTVLTTA